MRNFEQEILVWGQEFTPNFCITEADAPYYTALVQYFTKRTDKGLYVAGEVGTGKTISMKIMQRMFGGFSIISSRHLVREFMQSKVNGMDVLDAYGRNCFKKDANGNRNIKQPIQICIDDLGLDDVNSKLYGNQVNIFMEILLDRYECWVEYGMKTLITTNASPKMMEESYGLRVRERLREMCETITITGKSKR